MTQARPIFDGGRLSIADSNSYSHRSGRARFIYLREDTAHAYKDPPTSAGKRQSTVGPLAISRMAPTSFFTALPFVSILVALWVHQSLCGVINTRDTTLATFNAGLAVGIGNVDARTTVLIDQVRKINFFTHNSEIRLCMIYFGSFADGP